MDGLKLYYDSSMGLYRYTDEAEDDSGVEDLPFTFYSGEMYGSPDIPTQRSASNDADDEDLTYIDDITDGDYRPRKSSYTKKGKRQYRRRQYSGNTCLSQLMTPEKQHHTGYSVSDMGHISQVRHYARKDRTPNTIMKMMERHRESERVRHHTLNESMKDVCLRVPGYDPDVKETKVIQMQRIIAYECFLENTLTNVCDKIGLNPKTIKLSTHFITDVMKSTPIEEFYQPSHYKTSDIEEGTDHGLKMQLQHNMSPSLYKAPRQHSNEKKYRREKISSPTIDSTTSDLIKVLPVSPISQMTTGYQFFPSGCIPAQCFIPIEHTGEHMESSQESGIKMEGTQSSLYDDDHHFNGEMGSFMDQGICVDPDQYRTLAPSFMKEEVNSSSITNTESEQFQAFDLSSPIRNHEKVFLQSPKSSGIMSRSGRSRFLGKADTPMGKEMQSVSPENVLETMPKFYNQSNQSTCHVTPRNGFQTKRKFYNHASQSTHNVTPKSVPGKNRVYSQVNKSPCYLSPKGIPENKKVYTQCNKSPCSSTTKTVSENKKKLNVHANISFVNATHSHANKSPVNATHSQTNKSPVNATHIQTNKSPVNTTPSHANKSPGNATPSHSNKSPVNATHIQTKKSPGNATHSHANKSPDNAKRGQTNKSPVNLTLSQTDKSPGNAANSHANKSPGNAMPGHTYKPLHIVTPKSVPENKNKVNSHTDKSPQNVTHNTVIKTEHQSYSHNQPVYSMSPQFMTAVCPVTDMYQLSAGLTASPSTGEIQYMYAPLPRQFSAYQMYSSVGKENGCIIYLPKFENGAFKFNCPESSGKNKRKRYTPLKSTCSTPNINIDSEEELYGMSSYYGETTDTDSEEHDTEMEPAQPTPQVPVGQYPYGFPQNWGYPAPAPCRGQGKKVKYAKPLVDHRKSTWMNGFMMFSKLNRSKFTSENPGVHTSQIQKLMGEAWRKLSAEEKQPYRDQAKEWCEKMKAAGDNANKPQTDANVKTEKSDQEKSASQTTSSSVDQKPSEKDESSSDKKEKKEKTSKTESKTDKPDTVNGLPAESGSSE